MNGSTSHARDHGRARSIPRLIVLWVTLVLGLVVVGSAGYVLIEHWSLIDALFMTVITMSTVGFREVHDLDQAGQLWTMAVIIAGVGTIFGTVGIVAEAFLAEAVSGRRGRRQMAGRVADMKQHFILCGYGRVGSTVARELEHSDIAFVVIDTNQQSLAAAQQDGHLVVAGDATRDEVLREAGIERARGLITTTDTDANNVYVTLSARALNRDLFIVARANDESAEDKLRQAGADRVVSPYSRAGRQIAELATRPRVADFIDFALSHSDMSFSIEEIEVGESLAGQTVADLSGRGIHTLAIARGPRQFEANPGAERLLEAGAHLIVSGPAEALRSLR